MSSTPRRTRLLRSTLTMQSKLAHVVMLSKVICRADLGLRVRRDCASARMSWIRHATGAEDVLLTASVPAIDGTRRCIVHSGGSSTIAMSCCSKAMLATS